MKSATFSFGKNWQNFLKGLNNEKIELAEKSIKSFLNTETITGKSFLDVGCGSGLFSYAAYRLGASQVTSFDYDPMSVQCGKSLHERAGSPNNWKIFEGSILDQNLIKNLGSYDIVYSWGVLHHTGHMWEAIKNAARIVKPNGYFYIAIYNKASGLLGSEFWLKIKKIYNLLPRPGKILMEWGYVTAFSIAELLKGKDPIKSIRLYPNERGMSWWIDMRDWLGGYPFEFATVDEVKHFIAAHFPKMQLEKIQKDGDSMGMNTFLFHNNDL